MILSNKQKTSRNIQIKEPAFGVNPKELLQLNKICELEDKFVKGFSKENGKNTLT